MNALSAKVLIGIFFMLTGTVFNCSAQLSCLTVNDIAVTEPDNGGGYASFKISLSSPSTQEVKVYYSTSNGTASSRNDYTANSGYLTFQPGETVKFLFIAINGDLYDEYDETFYLNLSNATNATICDNKGTATILDSDAPPTMTISNMAVREQDSGTVKVKFLIQLSNWSYKDITFDYATINGTATAGSDYQAASGTFTIPAAHIRAEIVVTSYGDTTKEENETFIVNYSNPVNVQLTNTSSSATIWNDDLEFPVVLISPYHQTVLESVDSVAMNLRLTRKGNIPLIVRLMSFYGNQPWIVDEAIPDVDYVALDSLVTFLPGELSKQIKFKIIDNAIDNHDKFIHIVMLEPQNGILDGLIDAGIDIIDDENNVMINVPDSIVVSEDWNSFILQLSSSTPISTNLSYSTEDGSAVAGSDYDQKSGNLTFNNFDKFFFDLNVIKTDDFEQTEYFYVNFSTPTDPNISLSRNRTKIIIKDTTKPTAIFSAPSVIEGNKGDTTDVNFQVKLNFPSPKKVKIEYAMDSYVTENVGGGIIADSNIDFILKSDSVVFMPGDTAKVITVRVIGDDTDENNEQIFVLARNEENVILNRNTGDPYWGDVARGNIIDDDDTPSISISDTTIIEGDDGVKMAYFRISLSNPSQWGVFFKARLEDLSTAKSKDYRDTLNYDNRGYMYVGLSIPPYRLLPIPIIGDTLPEINERFKILISEIQNAIVTDSIAICTIIDNDTAPNEVIGLETQSAKESAGILNVTVLLNEPASQPISVDYSTSDGYISGQANYVPVSGTLNFAIGDSVKYVPVTLLNDTIIEGDEFFNFNLSNALNAQISTPQTRVWVLEDADDILFFDSGIQFARDPYYASDTLMVFKVNLLQPNNHTVKVDYTTVPGTATEGSDYSSTSGVLTFLPGETIKEIAVKYDPASADEGDEYFYLKLSNPIFGHFVRDYFLDEDSIKRVFIYDHLTQGRRSVSMRRDNYIWIHEGNSGDTTLISVPLYLNGGPSILPVTVEFKIIYNNDYPGAFNNDLVFDDGPRVTFAPGETQKDMVFKVVGDNDFEFDEYFTAYPVNGINGSPPEGDINGYILNDDPPLEVTIGNDVTITEGDDGIKKLVFEVYTKNLPNWGIGNPIPAAVGFEVIDVTTSKQVDYFIYGGGVFGELSDTTFIIIDVRGDTINEGDESFIVRLLPSYYFIAGERFEAIGTILNDDGPVFLTSSAVSTENLKTQPKIANVFTPNGDGINDLFVIDGVTNAQNELIVFNKEGTQFFKRSNYQNDWDGQGCADGTYYYILKLKDQDGGFTTKKGYITLIRGFR
ncbi:hypothetical protein C3K47_16210 [Solitalea longa]|uniref:Calx-beta domain-containing protein n=1 Tax=Solitalea longa TaxID=2079460 RepID=A0A2S4ZZ99_9SPHI|nr:Calx-beta domain-containing protein [Solitalea longa]POY35327.1 hypothetical protein C3K47_16210 [Solitalea longa]